MQEKLEKKNYPFLQWNEKWPFGANEDLLSKDKKLQKDCLESAQSLHFWKKMQFIMYFKKMEKNVFFCTKIETDNCHHWKKRKGWKNCKTYVLLLSIHCVVNSKRSRKDISNCTAEEILSVEFWSFIIGITKMYKLDDKIQFSQGYFMIL